MIELFLFWTCCLAAIAGALGAAVVRNLFHAALLLGLSLAGVAGLYLFLEAGALLERIVQLGVGVAELLPAHEALETLTQAGPRTMPLSQRRHNLRVSN